MAKQPVTEGAQWADSDINKSSLSDTSAIETNKTNNIAIFGGLGVLQETTLALLKAWIFTPASQSEVDAGSVGNKYVSPATLRNNQSTDTDLSNDGAKLISRATLKAIIDAVLAIIPSFASQSEVDAGSVGNKYVSPATLRNNQSTDTDLSNDGAKLISRATLKAIIDALPSGGGSIQITSSSSNDGVVMDYYGSTAPTATKVDNLITVTTNGADIRRIAGNVADPLGGKVIVQHNTGRYPSGGMTIDSSGNQHSGSNGSYANDAQTGKVIDRWVEGGMTPGQAYDFVIHW